MSASRPILCILLPPLAVRDKGCGSVLLVAVLALISWVRGIICAPVICLKKE